MFTLTLFAAKDVSETYREMVITHIKSFVRFTRRSIHVDELTDEEVNAWLAKLKNSKLSPHTVDTYRRNLLCVWRAAVEEGYCDRLPLRVRKIKKPPTVVEACTHAELRKLLAAAAQLKGRHRNGNKRSAFWCALIHAAYSSGLRRGDLLLVRKSQIDSDGVATIVQHKTSQILRVKFSPEAMAFAAMLRDPNDLLLPWPYRKDALAPRFKLLATRAGVNRGSLKWVRRSAGSYAERDMPGAGSRLLGHRSAGVFRAHYEDRGISGDIPIQPPPLC